MCILQPFSADFLGAYATTWSAYALLVYYMIVYWKGERQKHYFYSEGYVEWTQSTIQQSLKGTYQQIWIPFHQEWFVPSLVEICLVVLKKKISFS